MRTIGKTRHAATSSHGSGPLSDSENEQDKENQSSKGNVYRNKADSSDDDFDQCELIHIYVAFCIILTLTLQQHIISNFYVLVLAGRATPKTKATSQKPCSPAKNVRYENYRSQKTKLIPYENIIRNKYNLSFVSF